MPIHAHADFPPFAFVEYMPARERSYLVDAIDDDDGDDDDDGAGAAVLLTATGTDGDPLCTYREGESIHALGTLVRFRNSPPHVPSG